MKTRNRFSTVLKKAFTIMLSATMILTVIPAAGGQSAEAESGLQLQTPDLLVTGTGLIGNGGRYSKAGVSLEKSYTTDELKNLGAGKVISKQIYSTKKAQDPYTKNYYVVDGVRLASLLGKTDDSEVKENVTVVSSDARKIDFITDKDYENTGLLETSGLDQPRYLYDHSYNGIMRADENPVPTLIGWAEKAFSSSADLETVQTGQPSDNGYLRLYCGQLEGDGPEDMNQQLFNKEVCMVVEGEPVNEVILAVGSKEYTRSDILEMAFTERKYTYETQNGTRNDNVRGVPVSALLGKQDDNTTVLFETVDGKSERHTVQELVSKNYVLAYELNGSGVYDEDSDTAYGMLRLYGDGARPNKMVNAVTIEGAVDYGDSPYKHITNGGMTDQEGPYKIDAITGATLTLEGPGISKMKALSVKELEVTDKGCFRGVYTDTRNGQPAARTYEGVDIYYLLTQMGKSGINLTEKAYKVTVRNRNRQSIATLSLDQLKEMSERGRPALIAYGTANEDGSTPVPFVFNDAAGAFDPPGNEDGCLKFVYDLDAYGNQDGKYETFGNMAYIYVEEESEPGFRHHGNPPYDTAENSNYILTVTGDEIGREINFTVDQLEELVQYDESGSVVDNGYGYRDEYSLANSTYWYVNRYEGVKLWSLLRHSGISEDRADDNDTKVTFSVTDNYTGFDTFTLKELAHPELFGFYEKNAADKNDGMYVPNENLREDDPEGDKLATGYPVLVAYGVNDYPYVMSKSDSGYISGISNDGGPLRIISGKKDYHHANGSKQAKNLEKIIVGNNTFNYSTHKYQPEGSPYVKLKNRNLKVTVDNGISSSIKTYTVGDLEEIIYGGGLSKQKLAEVKVKDFYETADGDETSSDIYEGIDLSFFLRDIVRLTGSKGRITFLSSDAGSEPVVMDLEDVLNISDGYNSVMKLGNLKPLIAYAKNGYPLVTGTSEEEGWLAEQTLNGIKSGEDDTVYKVDNQGGPLKVVFPRISEESAETPVSISNITEISIELEPDLFAHIAAPYNTYADDILTVGGAGTRLDGEKRFTVEELEGRQSFALTADYSLRDKNGGVTQKRYRGLDLSEFLKDSVGINNKADKVLVYAEGTNEPVEFTWSEIRKSNYINSVNGDDDLHVLLAFGCAPVGRDDGKPLVADAESAGYDDVCGNDGGPLMLVVGQNAPNDANSIRCVKKVVKIEVTASDDARWNHSSSEVFSSYLDQIIRFRVVDKDGNELESVDYTVEELEAMSGLIGREIITATSTNEWEGLSFWPLIQTVLNGIKGIEDPVSISVESSDESSVDVVEKLGGTEGLKKGVKDGERYVPVLLAYACEGNPLASEGNEGYDPEIDNKGGPMRLMVHNKQGACISEVVSITVKISSSGSEPVSDPVVFDVFAGTGSEGQLPVSGLRATVMDSSGNLWIGTYGGGVACKAKGSNRFSVYNRTSEPSIQSTVVSSVCPDAEGGVYMTQNASYTEPEANRGVAYMKNGSVRYFRASDEPQTLPSDYVQEVKIDKDGIVWFGSDKGLTRYDPKSAMWQTWGKDDGFPATSIDNIEFDSKGGIWCGFYPDSEAGDGSKPFIGGFAYFKDGKVVKSYQYISPKDKNNGQYRLGDVWVRDIAVDRNDGAWVVASGSYEGMNNTGGRVWYISSPGTEALSYKGFELFGKRTFSSDSELRMVTVDQNGGIWFGTSKDGVLYSAEAAVNEGKMKLTAKYSSATGSWTSKLFDNVYSLDFYGNTLYAGSSGGLAVHEFGSGGGDKPPVPVISKPGKAKITLKAGKKKVTVKWKKVKDAAGYEVFRSLKKKKGFKKVKTITNGKALKFVNKKLKGKKVYYYKVRAYNINAAGKKVYGAFSAVKKVKTKK